MTQTQHVTVRPVPQYEPELKSEPTGDRVAMWEQHLAAMDRTGDADEL